MTIEGQRQPAAVGIWELSAQHVNTKHKLDYVPFLAFGMLRLGEILGGSERKRLYPESGLQIAE